MKKIRVALLAGGRSGEREVSLNGARGAIQAFDPEKYEVTQYDPATDLGRLAADAESIDVAFILLHGPFGEDGTVQGYLDLLGIPYQGSGVLGSAIAMDKNLSKILYQQAGLKTPDWVMCAADESNAAEIPGRLNLPLVIKPVGQGSSLGMSIPKTTDELAEGLKKAFEYGKDVMVEQFISGREITVGVIGNDELTALPLVEIIPGESYDFFDYEAKYKPGATTEVCPAEVGRDITSRAQEMGLIAHRALRLRGYSRTDMIVSGEDIYVLETNTIPGMTPTSLLPQAAQEYGLPFPELLARLLTLAMEK